MVKRYGRTIRHYKEAAFYKYCDFDTILGSKDIYSAEEYNRLPGNKQTLSKAEIAAFINNSHTIFSNSIYQLYSEREPEFELPPDSYRDLGL